VIIDYEADSHFAGLFHPLDLGTGQPVDSPVVYADDTQGIIRRYECTGAGSHVFKVDPKTREPVMIEERRAIRLVPTAGNLLKEAILQKQEEIARATGITAIDTTKRWALAAELEALAWRAAYLREQENARHWRGETRTLANKINTLTGKRHA
jgi:hypothetical protein